MTDHNMSDDGTVWVDGFNAGRVFQGRSFRWFFSLRRGHYSDRTFDTAEAAVEALIRHIQPSKEKS